MTNNIVLNIKKLNPNAVLPTYATEFSAGMDLSALLDEPMVFKPLDRKLVPTGLVFELPAGYEAQIRPRSGLSIKFGMTLINCVGTIDADYRGEVCIPMVNLSSQEYTIKPNERVAQVILSPVQQVKVKEVELVSQTARSVGGFGSTGK